MSVEAYIPYDLRERLAEQIKVIDKMMMDAVIAERERLEADAKHMRNDIELRGLEIERLGREIERYAELLRGVGANRYWEGRWRDEAAENERMRAENDQLRMENIELRQWLSTHEG